MRSDLSVKQQTHHHGSMFSSRKVSFVTAFSRSCGSREITHWLFAVQAEQQFRYICTEEPVTKANYLCLRPLCLERRYLCELKNKETNIILCKHLNTLLSNIVLRAPHWWRINYIAPAFDSLSVITNYSMAGYCTVYVDNISTVPKMHHYHIIMLIHHRLNKMFFKHFPVLLLVTGTKFCCNNI